MDKKSLLPAGACVIALIIGLFVFLLWPGTQQKKCWNHTEGIVACYDYGTIGLWPFREKVCHLYFLVPGQPTIGGKVPCKPQPRLPEFTDGGTV